MKKLQNIAIIEDENYELHLLQEDMLCVANPDYDQQVQLYEVTVQCGSALRRTFVLAPSALRAVSQAQCAHAWSTDVETRAVRVPLMVSGWSGRTVS